MKHLIEAAKAVTKNAVTNNAQGLPSTFYWDVPAKDIRTLSEAIPVAEERDRYFQIILSWLEQNREDIGQALLPNSAILFHSLESIRALDAQEGVACSSNDTNAALP